jgi:hypothetical protein
MVHKCFYGQRILDQRVRSPRLAAQALQPSGFFVSTKGAKPRLAFGLPQGA